MAKKRKWEKVSHCAPRSSYGDISKDQFLATITGDLPATVSAASLSRSQERALSKENLRQGVTLRADHPSNDHSILERRSSSSIKSQLQARTHIRHGQLHAHGNAQDVRPRKEGEGKQWDSDGGPVRQSGTEESGLRPGKTEDGAALENNMGTISRGFLKPLNDKGEPIAGVVPVSSRLHAPTKVNSLVNGSVDMRRLTPSISKHFNPELPLFDSQTSRGSSRQQHQNGGARATTPCTPTASMDGSDSETSSRFPRSAQRPRTPKKSRNASRQKSPSSPGRSPYVRRSDKPVARSIIPGDHDKRLSFPSRAERTNLERSVEDIKAKGGLFTPSEKERLHVHCASFKQLHRLSDFDFAELVQGSGSPELMKDLYQGIFELFEYRRHENTRLAVQRVYHNFKKATKWTEEDDQRLAQLIDKNGRKWSLIAKELDRHPEACRDRYRNYHHTKNQRLSIWEPDEDNKLRKAIGDNILESLQDQIRDVFSRTTPIFKNPSTQNSEKKSSFDFSEREASKALMWQNVADRVGQRSRIQCYHRFGRLRRNGDSSFLNELRGAMVRAGYENGKVHGVKIRMEGQPSQVPEGQRTRERYPARCKIKELYGGDKIALVQAVQLSQARRDDNIDWKSIREMDKSFRPFAVMVLMQDWEALKTKYELSKGKNLQPDKTRKTARRMEKWLSKTMTEAEGSRRWALCNRDPTPRFTPKNRGKNTPKSPYYVHEDDDNDDDDDDDKADDDDDNNYHNES